MFADFLAANTERLTLLRRELHAHPELSNNEHNTTKTLLSFFKKNLKHHPEIVEHVGGGFLAIFNFNKGADKGKTVVLRSELDAIPAQDKRECEHKSVNSGVAHHCGHDGHMTIVAGVALLLDQFHPASGRVVLLYQPAEEIGSGAQQMVDSPNPIFRSILEDPDSQFFALHNTPGYPEGCVVLPRADSFASASRGMHIKIKGKCTHASQPHLGKNPALAMCSIIQGLLSIPSLHVPYDQKALVTIVGARAGEKAFGVSAGDAEVMATLRATTNAALTSVAQNGEALASGIAAAYGLTTTIEYEDVFPATVNDPAYVEVVKQAASASNMKVVYLPEAFPWSEDFGVFLQHSKGAMFGLGAGEAHTPLHDDSYDFPDSLVSPGILIFSSIISSLLGGPEK